MDFGYVIQICLKFFYKEFQGSSLKNDSYQEKNVFATFTLISRL